MTLRQFIIWARNKALEDPAVVEFDLWVETPNDVLRVSNIEMYHNNAIIRIVGEVLEEEDDDDQER